MKIVKRKIETFAHTYPASVAIVLVKGREKLNAMAAAWHSPISFKPPLYGVSIAPKRFTHSLILENRDFSLNFFTQEHTALIHKLGHASGSNVDKFERFKIETESSINIKSPIIKTAYASYECKLHDHKTLGDHTFFVGEVVAIHYDEVAFSKSELIRFDVIKPAMYIGDDNYITTDHQSLVSTKDTEI